MRRDQLEHAIRTACRIIGHDAVVVVGSQAIFGSFDDDQLPVEATMSLEIDILPFVEDKDEAARLADMIEGAPASGRRSRSNTVSASMGLTGQPPSWQAAGVTAWSVFRTRTQPRLVGQPQYIGWCLDKEDLCVAALRLPRDSTSV